MNLPNPKEKSVVRAIVFKSLMPVLRELTRGDYITHEEIRKATNIDPDSSQGRLLVRHMKRIFINETGIEIFHDPGRNLAYKLATVEEQIKHNIDRLLKHCGRTLRRGKNTVEKTPDSDLDDRQRAVKYFRIESLAMKEAAIREKDELIKILLPKRKKAEE